ncbi:uncharacterized protein SPSK_04715 [Sporothrix schenckii 1099-18]|uniref:Uncharacterized protein n=1 Tax=Sporothrix schenckii 1099-18 TaxID=1397361 RepID=A0A0F2M318_SPOSC|nr:uncharacterized protein SPSK_04715 [Sporothrix schenckii 1099-18]KJR83489.1 hypothetical protein SPSK_04715 [Sporothrix schenckii 1099-18]
MPVTLKKEPPREKSSLPLLHSALLCFALLCSAFTFALRCFVSPVTQYAYMDPSSTNVNPASLQAGLSRLASPLLNTVSLTSLVWGQRQTE